MSRRTNLLVIAAAAVLAACGDETREPPGATAPTSSATPPGAPPSTTPTPERTPVATATGTPTPTPAATVGGGDEEGGDEDGNRPELHFDVLARGVEPARIEVPAFLGLRISLRNHDGQPRPVTLDGKPLTAVAPGQSETVEVEGLRPGRHVLGAGRSSRATIVAVRAGG